MRIAIVDTYYPAFLDAHYRARPGLRSRGYDEQLAALMERCFGTSNAYSHHLTELGHEPLDLVVNCFDLQAAWAREHGAASLLRGLSSLPTRIGGAARVHFLHRIARAQVEAFAPDVVYLQDLWFFDRAELEAWRAEGRLVAGQIASSPPGEELLRGFDLITTSFPHFVERFRALGVESEYFRIAFYERVLDRLRERGVEPGPEGERPHGIAFIGGVNPAVHARGVAMMEQVARRAPLEVWGYGADELPRGSPLLARYRGAAWGLEMYETLSRSRISLNRHIDVAEDYANNMRMFESTGVGALLVTEQAPNLSDLFAPGSEVVAYESVDDLIEKLEHYLAHDDERRAVATAGQRRTLAEHTYRQRIPELAELLEQRLRRR